MSSIAETDTWKLELLSRRAPEPREVMDEGGDDSSALMALAAQHGGRCWYCGCELTRQNGDASVKTTATRDHIIPRSKGGTNRADNLIAACRACNNGKRARSLEDYRAKLSDAAGGAPIVFYGEREK